MPIILTTVIYKYLIHVSRPVQPSKFDPNREGNFLPVIWTAFFSGWETVSLIREFHFLLKLNFERFNRFLGSLPTFLRPFEFLSIKMHHLLILYHHNYCGPFFLKWYSTEDVGQRIFIVNRKTYIEKGWITFTGYFSDSERRLRIYIFMN